MKTNEGADFDRQHSSSYKQRLERRMFSKATPLLKSNSPASYIPEREGTANSWQWYNPGIQQGQVRFWVPSLEPWAPVSQEQSILKALHLYKAQSVKLYTHTATREFALPSRKVSRGVFFWKMSSFSRRTIMFCGGSRIVNTGLSEGRTLSQKSCWSSFSVIIKILGRVNGRRLWSLSSSNSDGSIWNCY